MFRRLLIGSTLTLLVAAVPSAAQLARTAVIHVKPAAGSPSTRFVVSFTSPEATGRVVGGVRSDQLTAAAPASAPAHGCVRAVQLALPHTAAGAVVRATLSPARLGGRWCRGLWTGRITSIQAPVCNPGEVCPAFLLYRGVVGRFTFRVRAR